jgi:hypothetical protein
MNATQPTVQRVSDDDYEVVLLHESPEWISKFQFDQKRISHYDLKAVSRRTLHTQV